MDEFLDGFVAQIDHVQLFAFFHIVRNAGERLDRFGRNRQPHLHPVHLLAVAAPRELGQIIRVIVIGVKQAFLIEPFNQHTLAVHIGESQRTVHRRAAELSSPAFHGIKERIHHLVVVDEIHLREIHILPVKRRIGAFVENARDAAHNLPVAISKKRLGLAEREGRVFLLLHVGNLARQYIRHVIRISPIELERELHELDQVLLGHGFFDCYHLSIPLD
ncbi:hypothetical protein SDC9_142593 [bioreactor metagenome]|uniref:Uncharacterized protein n=1 Tax=bioreactor metagenome TaxID=1076179 RepID=A0A645E1L0_9ZZZZ